MRDLVYTCVFDNYDWVLPPISSHPGIHHILVTDQQGPKPACWQRLVVDPEQQGGAIAANRYWKILGYLHMSGFDRLLYIDANVRLLGDTKTFLDYALPPGATIALFRHPLRRSIAEEMDACLAAKKVPDPVLLHEEQIFYLSHGFHDNAGLSENTIIARRLGFQALDAAMLDWWETYCRFKSRDQFSLSFVRWRHALQVHWIDWSFRTPNPWFAIYGHRKGRGINPRFAWLEARSYDSKVHAAILNSWRMARAIRRGIAPQSLC